MRLYAITLASCPDPHAYATQTSPCELGCCRLISLPCGVPLCLLSRLRNDKWLAVIASGPCLSFFIAVILRCLLRLSTRSLLRRGLEFGIVRSGFRFEEFRRAPWYIACESPRRAREPCHGRDNRAGCNDSIILDDCTVFDDCETALETGIRSDTREGSGTHDNAVLAYLYHRSDRRRFDNGILTNCNIV